MIGKPVSITINSAPFIKTVTEELVNKGWTQAQLSEKTGFSRSQISRLLAGKNKRVQQSTVSKVLDALGISRDDFLATEDTKKTSTAINTKPLQTIYSDRLPTVTGQFMGRASELTIIDQALHDTGNNILQIIAPGGTGKTKLLRQWLNHSYDPKQSVIAWSFYSQGASTDKQASATSFFQHALALFGKASKRFASDEDKGDYLANLLREYNCWLILDGLEPLQYADAANRGEIKDRALSRLLRNLAGQSGTFCIITSRIAVYELSDRDSVNTHQLQNLTTGDGVLLLQSLGVRGSEPAIQQAVIDYNGHALALTLLGHLLRLRYQGDINQRDKLPGLLRTRADKSSRHAFKVMQAYEGWFAGTAELRLLYWLGLFDRPIGIEVLEALWRADISEVSTDIKELEWYQAIDSLRHDHHLLNDEVSAEQTSPSHQALDCHPLIREYFGAQFKKMQPEAWHAAHKVLFQYYQDLPDKELPDTLEEMRPLFEAVKHGCLAGLYEDAFEVYWRRISRKNKSYLSSKLGAYSDDLAVISHFFSRPWETLEGEHDEIINAFLKYSAARDLNALGRIREAYKPSEYLMTYQANQERWQPAASLAELIGRQQLTLGNLQGAIDITQLGIQYADSTELLPEKVKLLVLLAQAKLHTGERAASEKLLIKAKEYYQQENSDLPLLLLMPEYTELLIERNQINRFLEQVTRVQEWSRETTLDASMALNTSLSLVSFSKAFMTLPALNEAERCAEAAVTFIRQSGRKDLLPLPLLARAAVSRATNNFPKASQDLQEVYEIASPSGMRLYLTDYHLEMARVLLKQWQQQLIDDSAQHEIQKHIAAAVKLIDETGYHRRDKEVEALVGPIQSAPEKQKKWSEEW